MGRTAKSTAPRKEGCVYPIAKQTPIVGLIIVVISNIPVALQRVLAMDMVKALSENPAVHPLTAPSIRKQRVFRGLAG